MVVCCSFGDRENGTQYPIYLPGKNTNLGVCSFSGVGTFLAVLNGNPEENHHFSDLMKDDI